VQAITLIALSLVLAAPGPGAPRAKGTVHAVAASAGGDTARVRVGPAAAGTDAFVAWPAGRGTTPAVVLVHEWWGLNAQIRGVARRLAQEGYVTIVPDLYHGPVAGDAEMAHELSRGLDEERALADLESAVAWLRSQPRVGRGRIAVVGFCMGGRLGQLAALRNPSLAAAVMFYGRPETDPAKLAGLRVPLQGHFGGEDRGIGEDQVSALESGLRKAGRMAEIHTYHGAGHAFMHEGRSSYHADAARQAWARTLQFLQKHLKG
jgi:carboxymethylenebutenolidase